MNMLKKGLLWFYLLNKRFLKKPLLLLLFCLIPLISALAGNLPLGNADLLKVGLCTDNKEDSLALDAIDALCGRKGGAVRYISYKKGDALRAAVRKGDIQLGFLFPRDFPALLESYAQVPEQSDGVLDLLGQAVGLSESQDVDLKGMEKNQIQVICANNDVITKLEKEQLFGNLYDVISDHVLKAWMDAHTSAFPMSKEERDAWLDSHYEENAVTQNFFRLKYLSGERILDSRLDSYYLAPMKGLLAIILVLICFATCMFLTQDYKKGRFVWISTEKRPLFHYVYLLIPLTDGGIFAYLALFFLGLLQGPYELPAFILFLFSAAGFSNLVRILTVKESFFSASIPIVCMGCLFLTPVFFDLRIVPFLQGAFPTYYYLKALHDQAAFLPLALYAVLTGTFSVLLDWLRNR